MKAIYLRIPELPDLIDIEEVEKAVYMTIRENQAYGASSNDVDVMIAPSALKKFWRAFKENFERRFGTLYQIPDVPEMLAIPHFLYYYCTIYLPNCNSAMHVILNPAFEKDPNLVAVICWLAL